MDLINRRGVLSIKSIVVVACVFAGGAFLFGPVRSWANAAVERDADRSEEFNRRVKAQRHAAIAPELAQAGITVVETPVAPIEPVATEAAPVAGRVGLMTRVTRWWASIRSAEPVAPVLPIFRDSLGLLPGEKAYLPNGRVVEYDTTAYRFSPQTDRDK